MCRLKQYGHRDDGAVAVRGRAHLGGGEQPSDTKPLRCLHDAQRCKIQYYLVKCTGHLPRTYATTGAMHLPSCHDYDQRFWSPLSQISMTIFSRAGLAEPVLS